MANTIALRRRIKSVKSTRQITKAMELVSASKMRRAQESALASREYARTALQKLTRLREMTDVSKHPLYDIRPVTSRLYVVITSDRGLAGAYNSNVLRAFATRLKADKQAGVSAYVITVGKQAGRFAAKIGEVEILAAYDHMPEKPKLHDLTPLLKTAKACFLSHDPSKKPKLNEDGEIDTTTEEEAMPEVDEVEVIYTDYKSSIVQEVTHAKLLPAAFTDVEITADLGSALFEPSADKVLKVVTERLIEVQMLQMYLESQASEQSARMMAMKTASDNAGEIVEDLTLAANTARQSAITQELAEITGGAEAMK